MQSIGNALSTIASCYLSSFWSDKGTGECLLEETISNIASSSLDWMKFFVLFAGDTALLATDYTVNAVIDFPLREKALKVCQEAGVIGARVGGDIMQTIAPNAKEIINQEAVAPYSFLKVALAGGLMYFTANKASAYTTSAFKRLVSIVSGERAQTFNYKTGSYGEYTGFKNYTTLGLLKDGTIEFLIGSFNLGVHYLTKELMIKALVDAGESEPNARYLMTMISVISCAPAAFKVLKWLCAEEAVDNNYSIQMGKHALSYISGGSLTLLEKGNIAEGELIHSSQQEPQSFAYTYQPKSEKSESEPVPTPYFPYTPSKDIVWNGSKFTTAFGSSIPPSSQWSDEKKLICLSSGFDSPTKAIAASSA
jgi:hypothetical protein